MRKKIRYISVASILLFLANSCSSGYKPVDAFHGTRTGSAIQEIAGENFTIRVLLTARKSGDTAHFYVSVTIADVPKDKHLRISNLRVALADPQAGPGNYVLRDNRLRELSGGRFVVLDSVTGPALRQGRSVDLADGGRYSLGYDFFNNDILHYARRMELSLEADIEGGVKPEKIKKIITFRRYSELQPFH